MNGSSALTALVAIGWRNLWRNSRRTLIMLAAISVGVWAMIFMTALIRGMLDDMIHGAVSNFLDHGQIRHQQYADDPSIDNRLPAPGPALASALDRETRHWSQRIRVPAVIASERETTGVQLLAIDPQREAHLSFIAQAVVHGRYLENADDPGIIIGESLADQLETRLGRRIVVMTQGPDNQVADRGFRIVGIYRTALKNREKMWAFISLNTAQQFLGVGDDVTEIGWQLPDYNQAPAVAATLARDAGNADSRAWQDIDKFLNSSLSMMDGFVLVWILIVFTALSFGLVNTLAMAVFERMREFGLMKALGLKPSAIVLLVLAESLSLIALGLALGNALAWVSIRSMAGGIDISAVAQGMEMMGASAVLRPALYTHDLWLANAVVLGLGTLASCLPAWRAARLDPIAALRKS
ncbi:ABC transporter permease [Simiduia agarivorans]|uniref:ABC transporter permease n=1 Tax=Simiduia agarivorans (strain DSM 21679 / JCM 13881 / BCRC 17597 / SA1) TaxID=1117647 RepID=K4KMU5_SIMAS|nr:ABC transporter permease [Simiduia agarivorans]AFV00342.1 hypothetical protein M5M_16045 [Simiduia agarivorans SA1 = DSM 21679]